MQTIENKILSNFEEASKLLKKFIENENNLIKIEKAGKILISAIQNSGKIISCGNGGSMSDAMHFAEELSGRFRENRKGIPAIAVSDQGYISCVANDFGYKYIFSRFVETFANKNDVLLAISTSGNSENVLEAAKAARELNIHVIGLTGKDGGKLAELCDVEIRVEHFGYADRIQEIHIKIIHSLVDYIESNLK